MDRPSWWRQSSSRRMTCRVTLTPWRVVRYTRDGQPQYVYADPETCKCLYVGDEQRYQKYQELSLKKQIADEQMSAAETNWDASINWGAWGPWGW